MNLIRNYLHLLLQNYPEADMRLILNKAEQLSF